MKLIDADKLIKKVRFARDNFYKQVDIEPKDEASLFCGMYCDALLQQIQSLQQEQPEVDLEKEIKFFLTNAIKMNKGQWRGEYHIGEIGIRAIAHRFYELGLKARKEK